MAIFLVDLATGKTIARQGAMNPQIAYGEDVVARIAYANQSEADRLSLQRKVVETLNTSIAQLCKSVGVMVDQIMDLWLWEHGDASFICRAPCPAAG